MLLNARGIIKESFLLYKKNLKSFLPFVLLLLIPYVLISLMPIVNVFIYSLVKDIGGGMQAIKILGFLLMAVIYITLIIFTLWASTALTRLMNERYGATEEKAPVSTKEEFNNAKKYLWPLITTGILTVLIVIGGTLLLVIPGIIFGLWYGFTSLAVMLDEKKGMEALNYSKSLVKGRWWGVFWRLFASSFVFGVISSIVQTVVLFPFGFLTYYANNILINSLSMIIVLAISALMLPFSMAIPVILYRELKNNKISTTELPQS